MLVTSSRVEERILGLVASNALGRGTAADLARRLHGDIDDIQAALDELVARGDIRRHDIPRDRPVYWS